ncbi:MAG: GxxExxY protein [Bacteroidota bacterium]
MSENDIAKAVVHTSYLIHTQLGPGLFESVYEEILAYELYSQGFSIQRQHPISLIWKDQKLEKGFRADLIINEKVILEIKSVELIAKVHQKQLLTYLRLAKCKLGLLINFNSPLIKDGIQRIVNNL